jgi:hypothetical protein
MELTPTYRKIRRRPEQAGQPIRHPKIQTPQRTVKPVGNGFLKKTFAPVTGQRLAALGRPAALERELFNSLFNLAKLYKFSLPETTRQPYPYPLNITHALEAAKQLLQKKNPELELAVLRDKDEKIHLATIRTFNTGGWLYYIPVKPLWDLYTQRRRNRKSYELLLSTFAYLYTITGVPYFTNGSYLDSTYEMLEDWYREAVATDEAIEAGDERLATLEEHRFMRYAGNKLLKSITHSCYLGQWAYRLQTFQPANQQQLELHRACQSFYELWEQYGSRDIFAASSTGIFYPEEEERVYPDYYTSFFWSGEGFVYEQLMEAVNASFESAVVVDEPIAIQYFDTPQESETHDLRFEEKFFEAIHQLCAALNNHKWKI